MTKITDKIMKINFTKKLKQLIIVALCVALLGGGLSAFLLKGQIGKVITNVQEWHENKDDYRHEMENEESDHHEIGKEHHKGSDAFENIHITEPSIAAKITVGVTGLLCVLAAAAFWLLIAAWLYKAAVLSGMNGLLWFLLGLCGNLFAVILFYLVRSFKRQKCSSCGHYSSVAERYCTKCGAALTEKCPKCGETVRHGDKFCPSCGKQMPKN